MDNGEYPTIGREIGKLIDRSNSASIGMDGIDRRIEMYLKSILKEMGQDDVFEKVKAELNPPIKNKFTTMEEVSKRVAESLYDSFYVEEIEK